MGIRNKTLIIIIRIIIVIKYEGWINGFRDYYNVCAIYKYVYARLTGDCSIGEAAMNKIQTAR